MNKRFFNISTITYSFKRSLIHIPIIERPPPQTVIETERKAVLAVYLSYATADGYYIILNLAL